MVHSVGYTAVSFTSHKQNRQRLGPVAYHESPVDLPYERDLSGIRLRYTARVVYIAARDGLDALQIGFLVIVPCILLALDDCILEFSRHASLLFSFSFSFSLEYSTVELGELVVAGSLGAIVEIYVQSWPET